ncbi:hypothetical protein ACNHYB_13740 [Isoptericola jiangsuensis]|uniref:hypothetical protein n=1 Tax=Isoptericola jiangsuensis TaxID=548579 RepID=UPI003AB09C1F
MARSARPARPLAVVGVVAASALLLGACAPVTTELGYAPSDGTRVDFEDSSSRGLNLMVVSAEEGGSGRVLGALSNASGDDVEFVLSTEGAAPVSVSVPANDTVYLGTADGEEVVLDTVATIPGGFLDATLTAGDLSSDFALPVMDAANPEYASSAS